MSKIHVSMQQLMFITLLQRQSAVDSVLHSSSQSVDCGSYKLYLCVCLSLCVCMCLCVCLSRFYGLYLGYYGSDFNQTWYMVKTLEDRCIVLKFHRNRFSVDVIMTSFLFFKLLRKGSYSAQSQRKKLCKGKQLCCARL